MSAESPAELDKNAPLTGAVTGRKTRLQRLPWPLMSLSVIAVLGGGAYCYINGRRDQTADRASPQAATESTHANVGGHPTIARERHPLGAQAPAALDRAQLNLSYTVISAPTDGVVAKVEQLQVGDTIAASAPVFALVSTRDVWIEANFKEVQLARMRPGQVATVKIDRYPGRAFSAEVTSVSPSTGSQFSLLPPENATAHWGKLVHRLPLRLQLPPADPGFLFHARPTS